ncbi:MAG: hypothetical protein AAGF11_12115 [Myxococcota bacterium]
MRLYVETNFVLELTLEQTECEACEQILVHAEQGHIELALPAFSIFEANYTLSGKKTKIRAVTDAMNSELKRQLERTQDFTVITKKSTDFAAAWTGSLQQAELRLEALSERLLRVVDVLPFDRALLCRRSVVPVDLGFADAMVYAAIDGDPKLGQAPSCFVTTNSRDFRSPDVTDPLENRDCKVLFAFSNALQYVIRS